MSYGVTLAGFKRKTYAEILADLQLAARSDSKFGPDVDLSVYSAEGAFIYMLAEALDEQWQLAEKTYYSAFLETSEGVSLDRVVAIGGMKRQGEKKALATVAFTGDEASDIDIGAIVSTPQNIQFEVIESGTIPESGVISLVCRALVAGPDGIVPADSITELTTTIPGVDSLTNVEPSSGGTIRELDVEVRARYRERGISGGSSVPAIEAALEDVQGVTSALVYENASYVEDEEGRPPTSIEVLVLGTASDEDIAFAIYSTKGAGIEAIGDESYTLTDVNDRPHTEKWNIPTELQTYVVYRIETNSEWNESSRVSIKTNSVIHIGGVDTIESVSTEYAGLGVGKDVLTWRLEAAQGAINGIETIESVVGSEERVSSQSIQSISLPSTGVARYTVSGTPFSSVVAGDILFSSDCTDDENNGAFEVQAVGSGYVDVYNDLGIVQAGAVGDLIVIIGEDEKLDLTSRQVSKTTTSKIGVSIS